MIVLHVVHTYVTADILSELGGSQWHARLYFNMAFHQLAANEVRWWIIALPMTK